MSEAVSSIVNFFLSSEKPTWTHSRNTSSASQARADGPHTLERSVTPAGCLNKKSALAERGQCDLTPRIGFVVASP